MKISIICAMDEKKGIGKNNKIPWHISEDFKRFRQMTTGHPIVMGRKTYQSIGRPLLDRTNIVVTRDASFNYHKLRNCKNCDDLESCMRSKHILICHSLGEAINFAKTKEKEEIFIIGGGQIYQQALPFADKLYLTILEGDFGADTFFPDYSEFKKVISEESKESEGYKYKFLELER